MSSNTAAAAVTDEKELDTIPRPAEVSLAAVARLRERVPTLQKVSVWDPTMETLVVMALTTLAGDPSLPPLQKQVYHTGLKIQLARAAPDVEPPRYELDPRDIVPIQRTADNAPDDYALQMYAQTKERHGAELAMDEDLIDKLTQYMSQLSVGETKPIPLLSPAVQERMPLVVDDTDGPIAAAIMNIPQKHFRIVSKELSVWTVRQLIRALVERLPPSDPNSETKAAAASTYHVEWALHIQQEKYTLMMRLATRASLTRRGLWRQSTTITTKDVVHSQ